MSLYPWQSATLPDYVLLDPTASKRLARWLQRQDGPRAYLFDVHDLPREASPVLLALVEPSRPRQVDELLRMPDGTSSQVWLWSPLALDALAAHLGAPIKPASSLGRIVFRYYDPRLLSRLPTILRPPQWQQLMAPLSHCAGQDGEGKGFEWQGEAVADATPADWELDDEQLERCGDWGLALLMLAAYWAWWTYGPDERVYSTRAYNYNERTVAAFTVNGQQGLNVSRKGKEDIAGGGGGIVVGQVIDVNRPLVVEWQMDYATMEDAFAKRPGPAYRAVLPPLREQPGIPDNASRLVLHFYPDHVEADFDQSYLAGSGSWVEPRAPRGDGGKAQPIAPLFR